MLKIKSASVGAVFALLACAAAPEAQTIINPNGLPTVNPTFTGTLNGTPSYAGLGNLSNAGCFAAPSQISTSTHCFAYGTNGAEIGQLELYGNDAGDNVFGITQLAPTGFAALTFRGDDPFYTSTSTPFEHLAIGWGGTSNGYDYIESSSFDFTSNRLLPPAELRFQATGGVDASGGTSNTCAVTSGSTTITCTAAITGSNGNLVTGSLGNTFPATTGIPAATTISGISGTTGTLSTPATATVASQTVTFTNPTYNQYTYLQITQTGPIYFKTWAGTPFFTLLRTAGTAGVGTLQTQGKPAATLEVGGTEQVNSTLTTLGPTALACNDYTAPTSGTTYTIPNGKCGAEIEPSGTLAALTVKMPASVVSGQKVWFSFTQTITALTVSPNTGQVFRSNTTPTTASPGNVFSFCYNANTVWYPCN